MLATIRRGALAAGVAAALAFALPATANADTTWGAAHALPSTVNATPAGLPAVNAAGSEAITYGVTDAGATRVGVAVRAPGGAWSAPVPVSQPGATATATSLFVTADGHVVVTWVTIDPTTHQVQPSIWSATGTSDGTFGAPLLVTADATGGGVVRIDGAGNATAMWRVAEATANQYTIKVADLPAGASAWSAPTTLVTGLFRPVFDVQVNASGDAIAMWSGPTGYETRSRPHGASTWGATQTALPAAARQTSPVIAIAPDGSAVLAAHGVKWAAGVVVGDVRTVTRPPNGTWGSRRDVSRNVVGGISVAALAPSQFVVAFQRLDQTRFTAVPFAMVGNGARWSGAMRLGPAHQDVVGVTLAPNGSGAVVADWYDMASQRVFTQTRGASAWGTVTRFSNAAVDSGLAAAGTHAVLTFVDATSGDAMAVEGVVAP